MKLPRNLKGTELIKALAELGYHQIRQVGSHVRLSTDLEGGHQLTVPLHAPLRVGTLSAILSSVAAHHKLTRDQLIAKLFREQNE